MRGMSSPVPPRCRTDASLESSAGILAQSWAQREAYGRLLVNPDGVIVSSSPW